MIALWLWAEIATAACTVIAGATVHTDEGPQKGLTVVVGDGRIAALGRGISGLDLELDAQKQVAGARWQASPCTFVQGGGQQLTAGFVAVPTGLGLVEVSLEGATRDNDPQTEDPVRAALRAADAYDPRSTVVPVTRIEGITAAVTTPGGGFVSGQAAWVRLAGDRQSEAVVDPRVAMVASMPSASFAESLRQIRELVSQVEAWRRDGRRYEARGADLALAGASPLDLEALLPVVQGRMPLMLQANRASELEALAGLADELDLKLIVVGAAEGWRVADVLAAAEIPVIVDPLVYGAGGFDQLQGRPDNAALLVEAGVPVILSAFSTHNARTLRQVAGNAVRGGLDHAKAIEAITTVPADVFGQPSGRIAAGAPADLALWSGDPLELSTSLAGLWIDGVSIPLTSRQTELAERYLTLPATPAVLDLPK